MKRFVRIFSVMVTTVIAAIAVHNSLDLGPEFMGPGVGGIIDLALLVAGMLLTSLSDRELFWGAAPKQRRSRRRSRTAA